MYVNLYARMYKAQHVLDQTGTYKKRPKTNFDL